MAAISKFPARDCWRVEYSLFLKDRKLRKPKYPKTKAEARHLTSQLEQLEQATRDQFTTQKDLEVYVQKGWLEEQQAASIFTGYEDVIDHKRRTDLKPPVRISIPSKNRLSNR